MNSCVFNILPLLLQPACSGCICPLYIWTMWSNFFFLLFLFLNAIDKKIFVFCEECLLLKSWVFVPAFFGYFKQCTLFYFCTWPDKGIDSVQKCVANKDYPTLSSALKPFLDAFKILLSMDHGSNATNLVWGLLATKLRSNTTPQSCAC